MFNCAIEPRGNQLMGFITPAAPLDLTAVAEQGNLAVAAGQAESYAATADREAGNAARTCANARREAAEIAHKMAVALEAGNEEKYAALTRRYEELLITARECAAAAKVLGRASARGAAMAGELRRASELAAAGVYSSASSNLQRAQALHDATSEVYVEGSMSPGAKRKNRRRDRDMGIGQLGALAGAVEDRINGRINDIARNFCANADAGACAAAAIGSIFGGGGEGGYTKGDAPDAAKCALCAGLSFAGGVIANNLGILRTFDALGLLSPILTAAYEEAFNGAKPTATVLADVRRWFTAGDGKWIESASVLVVELQKAELRFAPNAAQLQETRNLKDAEAARKAAEEAEATYLARMNAATTSSRVSSILSQIASDKLLDSGAKSRLAAMGQNIRNALRSDEERRKGGSGGGGVTPSAPPASGGGAGLLLAAAAGAAALLLG